MNNKAFRKVITLLLCAVFIFTALILPSQAKAAESGYTYSYDWWTDPQLSPDVYETIGVYTAVDLGVEGKLNSPEGLTVRGNKVYICDTKNNRILELERVNEVKFELIRVIDSFTGLEEDNTLNGPTDIAFDADGNIYIADNGNHRILKLTEDLEYVMQLGKPDDANIAEDAEFLPKKIVVDTAGRVYVVATNVNQGLIKYETDGKFSGFIGATKVVYNFYDYLKKRLATKAQREQMIDFVPTEYTNIYMDHEGFIFACSINVKEADLFSGSSNIVRRLNLLGNDILIRNGVEDVVGDYWTNGGESGYNGCSLFQDVTCLTNGVYMCIDKTRSRIFGYDDQGRFMFTFGGPGNEDGYFRGPVAIDHIGNDIIVLDSIDCSISLFTPTEFGKKIFEAIDEFQAGNYEASGNAWKAVMAMNGNYDLAYIGIGRALLRQKQYREAMEYFELKWDDENYSKAFKQYRKIWVEENIGWIIAILAIIIFVPMIRGRIKKIKFEIDNADIFKYKKYDI